MSVITPVKVSTIKEPWTPMALVQLNNSKSKGGLVTGTSVQIAHWLFQKVYSNLLNQEEELWVMNLV